MIDPLKICSGHGTPDCPVCFARWNSVERVVDGVPMLGERHLRLALQSIRTGAAVRAARRRNQESGR